MHLLTTSFQLANRVVWVPNMESLDEVRVQDKVTTNPAPLLWVKRL